MDKERRYSEKEMIQILKSAMTQQDNARSENKREPGFSYDELRQIARDAGIGEKELQLAAQRVDTSVVETQREFLNEIRTERWIPGRLTDDQIEDMFVRLRNAFSMEYYSWWGSPVSVKKLGKTREFWYQNARVAVTDKGNGYLLGVYNDQTFSGSAMETAVLAIPVAFVLGLLPVAGAEEFIGTFVAVLAGVISYVLSLYIVKSQTMKARYKNRDKLIQIADKAESILLESVSGHQIVEIDDQAESDSETTGLQTKTPQITGN